MFGRPSKRELLRRIEALERKTDPICEPNQARGWRLTLDDLINDFHHRFKPVEAAPRTWVPREQPKL